MLSEEKELGRRAPVGFGVSRWTILNTKNFQEGLSLESEDGLETLKKDETNRTAGELEEK